jgi:RNA polymerase sigma-70 factor (ECF subfamily)
LRDVALGHTMVVMMTLHFGYLFADPPEHDSAAGSIGRHLRLEPAPRTGLPEVRPLTATDESALVLRIAQGDEDAFRTLYERVVPGLWDFARSLSIDGAQADELVQDAFSLLWQRAATWNPRTHVRGFLFTTVRHLVRNQGRHNRTVVRTAQIHATDVAGTAMAPPPIPPDVAAEHQDLLRAVLQGIAELPEPRRTALVLRWREELPYEEIAGVLGVSVQAAQQLVTRARTALRKKLEPLIAK